jgi:hypothetical protein
VDNRLLAFRADTGEPLLDLDLHMGRMSPPILFTIEGKQYISVAGGPEGSGGFGAPPPRATKDGASPPQRPGHLLLLTLDRTTPVPGAP